MLYVFSSYTSEIIKSWNCTKTLGIACLWQSVFFVLFCFFFSRKGIVTWWKSLRLWRDTKPRFKSSFATFSWAIWEHTLTSLTMNCSSVNQLYNTLILYDWRLEATCIKYCLLRVYLCLPARMVLAEWEPLCVTNTRLKFTDIFSMCQLASEVWSLSPIKPEAQRRPDDIYIMGPKLYRQEMAALCLSDMRAQPFLMYNYPQILERISGPPALLFCHVPKWWDRTAQADASRNCGRRKSQGDGWGLVRGPQSGC